MSRNDAFEEGQAAEAVAHKARKYSNPYTSRHEKNPEDALTSHIMMGNHPSGATSATISLAGPSSTTRIYKGDKNIGVLDLNRGSVNHIQTAEDSRRKGVATTMYRIANFAMGRTGASEPIKHGETRTPSGDAWARSTGDSVPEKTASFGISTNMLKDRK